MACLFYYGKIREKLNQLPLSQDSHPRTFSFSDLKLPVPSNNLEIIWFLDPMTSWLPFSEATRCLPRSPSEAPSLVPSAKVHRRGLLTACFGCQGKKVQVQKTCPIPSPPPWRLLPQPRSISQTAVGSCSWEVKPAEAIGGGVSGGGGQHLSWAHSGLSTYLPHFLWVFSKWIRGRHGRHLSPGTQGCLSSAPTRTHQQPVASIVAFRHPS